MLLFAVWLVFTLLELIIRPWKNLFMMIIETIHNLLMLAVLLGYMLLLLNDDTNAANIAHRNSLGGMIVAFGFLGVLFNFVANLFYCVLSNLCTDWLLRTTVDPALTPVTFYYPEYQAMYRKNVPFPNAPVDERADNSITRKLVDVSQIGVVQAPVVAAPPLMMVPPPTPLMVQQPMRFVSEIPPVV